ncbi:MAG: CBS domain-containing protein [Candidatus Sericytochromatia bacterium]
MIGVTNNEKEKILHVSIDELMVSGPLSINFDKDLKFATEFMLSNKISALPIVNNENKLIGVISQTDIARYLNDKVTFYSRVINSFKDSDLDMPLKEIFPDFLKLKEINHVKVKDVMTNFSYAVTKKTPVFEMLKEMKEKHIHHVYVLNDNGALIGVISSMDIIKYLTI